MSGGGYNSSMSKRKRHFTNNKPPTPFKFPGTQAQFGPVNHDSAVLRSSVEVSQSQKQILNASGHVSPQQAPSQHSGDSGEKIILRNRKLSFDDTQQKLIA